MLLKVIMFAKWQLNIFDSGLDEGHGKERQNEHFSATFLYNVE